MHMRMRPELREAFETAITEAPKSWIAAGQCLQVLGPAVLDTIDRLERRLALLEGVAVRKGTHGSGSSPSLPEAGGDDQYSRS